MLPIAGWRANEYDRGPGEVRQDRINLLPRRIGGVEALVDKVACSPELEDGLHRIQLPAAGRQAQKRDTVRDLERPGAPPAGAVKVQQRKGTPATGRPIVLAISRHCPNSLQRDAGFRDRDAELHALLLADFDHPRDAMQKVGTGSAPNVAASARCCSTRICFPNVREV